MANPGTTGLNVQMLHFTVPKPAVETRFKIAPETPERKGVGENVSANFVQLVWHSAYECGNPLVNDQHRGLFGDANKLLSAILSGMPKEISALIEVLIGDVVQHFQDEEGIISAAGFPGAAKHATIHRQLVNSQPGRPI